MVAVDLYQEKYTSQIIEIKTLYDRQDIEVLLFIVNKIKLKFISSLNTRVRYIRKFSLFLLLLLLLFFSYIVDRARENGGRLELMNEI